jgi:LPXTG-motif cell wall-anchored protein
MQGEALVLRDVHVSPAPPLWPPAPGWWLVIGVVALLLALGAILLWRRRRRLRAWQRMFDEASRAPQPAQQAAAISELLRRAARRVDAKADRLQGEDWLRFLDGKQATEFSRGPGRVLLDGGYRRELDERQLTQAAALARSRFLELMAGKR